MKTRRYTLLDEAISIFDDVLSKTREKPRPEATRDYPAESHAETSLDSEQKHHIAGLMRVNHAGEIAAQALYKAQALTAREDSLRDAMQKSAEEEIDHLAWCESRISELNDQTSKLEPLWYTGSFGIGLLAGAFGDKWNLGFLAETEYQVVQHIDEHLKQVPEEDKRTRAILEQMREDELQHASKAKTEGGRVLPEGIKRLMNLTSKIMTKTAYYI